MTEQKNSGGWDFSEINWPGVIAGVILILLPFAGFWWEMHIGKGAFDIFLSPFSTEIMAFGDPVPSPLLYWLNIAFTFLMILFGALILIGSILCAYEKHRVMSGTFLVLSSRKPLYIIIVFTIGIAAAGFYIGHVLDVSGLSASVPVLIGEGAVTAEPGLYSANASVTMGLSAIYWLGLAAAIIAVLAGYYQQKKGWEIN